MNRTSTLALALITLTASAALADDQTVGATRSVARPVSTGFQFETSVASTYIFRGIPQYNHLYDPSSQNTALLRLDNIGPGSLTFSVWNATALTGYGGQPGTALEIDVIGGYSVRLRDTFDVGVGYIGYLYPSHRSGSPLDGAHELTASVAVQNRFVVPQVAVFGEFLRQKGVYVAIGAARDFAWRALTVTPALNLGLAAYQNYMGGSTAAPMHINDATASLTGKVSLPSDFYISARVSYSLRGTPASLMPSAMDQPGFDGRSSLYGAIALGIAR